MKNELCGTDCSLMTGLCAARTALAPLVTEAEVVSEVAYTVYDASKVMAEEAARDTEVATLNMHWTRDTATDDEEESTND